jgi:ABC-type branched-subunit amino acid transport system substrate-binding protein
MVCDYGFALHAEWKKGVEALVSAVNAAGGLQIGGQGYLVDLIIYDDKLVTSKSPETSQSAIQKLISQDKVDFILGDDGTATWVSTTVSPDCR